MWRDLRYAVAGLWRSPVFTVAAVAALGLAIGANATIFGLVDGLWFRPPGVRDATRLTWIFATTPQQQSGTWSYPEYEALRDSTSSFSGVVARGRRGAALRAADGTQELALVNVVSPNFFAALGVTAAEGRVFGPGDEAAGGPHGVVLGHAFWRRRFGGDRSIVGQTISLMRGQPIPVQVLGVLPEGFRDLDAAADRDLWMPPSTWALLENRLTFQTRDDRWFDVLAVRAAAVGDVRRAQADVARVAAQMAAAFPETNAGRGARVVSHLSYRLEEGGLSAIALLGLVLLVVLITCVNVANLLLARAAARTRELAVRAALGATRRRLLRQMLTESLLLGALGATAGLTLALWLIRLIPVLLVAPPGFRSYTIFQADARVLAFTLVVTLLTTALFGAAPSWFAARTDVVSLLKGAPGALRNRLTDRVLGRALIVAQVAVSLVLLCAAAVLIRSFAEMRHADIGLGNANVLTAWSTGGERAASRNPATREALQRLAALPGVVRASVAFRAPLSLSGDGIAKPTLLPGDRVDPSVPPRSVKFNAVSRDYFATLGTRVLAGRVFGPADEQPGEPVTVVSDAFARAFFPAGDALGSVVRFGTPADPPHRIIGIVQNVPISSVTETAQPYFYLPYWRASYGEGTFLIQTRDDPAAIAPAVRDALRSADPALDPRRMITMGQYLEYSGSEPRATAVLASILGVVGLLMTVLGVYGVTAYRTTRRAREIGIRIALGADPRDVLRLVLREGAWVAALGLAVGIPAALLATRAMKTMLYGVHAWDARAFVGASALLFLCVCAAALIPARRATRVSPAVTLKE